MTVAEVVDHLMTVIRRDRLTGITVTGGEPFQQHQAVAETIADTRSRYAEDGDGDGLDVLIFTGYTSRVAKRRSPDLFAAADALVCGRYEQQQPSSGPLTASANQELVVRSNARDRYYKVGLTDGPRLQVAAVDGDIMLVGLPRPGDLDTFANDLGHRGVQMEGVSWRP